MPQFGNDDKDAKYVYERAKKHYKYVSIAKARKRCCANCRKYSHNFFEIRVRCVNKLPRIGFSGNKISGNRKEKRFSHLAYVCSKSCETMFILKVV